MEACSTWIKRGAVKDIPDLYYDIPGRVFTVIYFTASESQQMEGLRKNRKITHRQPLDCAVQPFPPYEFQRPRQRRIL